MATKYQIKKELQMGGDWLGAAHEWMQWNLRNGSTVHWGSHEEVCLSVHDIEQFALTVAVATTWQERIRAASNNGFNSTPPNGAAS